MTFDAIVPAGGRACRLGGIAKPLMTIDGVTLLDLALRAAAGARHIVVVGPPGLPIPPGVTLAREDPPFGGPAAAVAAGMANLPVEPAAWVLLLAADLPRASELVAGLIAAAPAVDPDRPDPEVGPNAAAGADALVGVDDGGRRQWLAGLYRTSALAAAIRRAGPDTLAGLSMRRLLAGLTVTDVRLPEWASGDVDTPDDAARWKAAAPPLPGPGSSEPVSLRIDRAER